MFSTCSCSLPFLAFPVLLLLCVLVYMVCLCVGRRGMDDGYSYGMQPSSARASVASSEGYGPNRASRSTHEDAFGGGDPLGEPPLHSTIHASTSLPFFVSACLCLLCFLLNHVSFVDGFTCFLLVCLFTSVCQSVNQSNAHSHAQPHVFVYIMSVINALCLCQHQHEGSSA